MVYESISLEDLGSRLTLDMYKLRLLVEEMILEGLIDAQIREDTLMFKKGISPVPMPSRGKVNPTLETFFDPDKVIALKGGEWKVEVGQSIFLYKVKVKNSSNLTITDIHIILTNIPKGLQAKSKTYEIHSLKPGAFESPTFKLHATESCVGDSITGIVTYSDPSGQQQTLHVAPLKIRYVCNLLVPKEISKSNFDSNTVIMDDEKLIMECNGEMDNIQGAVSDILEQNNFYVLPSETVGGGVRKIDGYAKGKYDNTDVRMSIVLQKLEAHSRLIIKAMSKDKAKLTDLLRDISSQCDDKKSDTEYIKEYTPQIEDLLNTIENLEDFLIDKLGSDWDKVKNIWSDYKQDKITKKQLIGKGIVLIGKKFIKKLLKSGL